MRISAEGNYHLLALTVQTPSHNEDNQCPPKLLRWEEGTELVLKGGEGRGGEAATLHPPIAYWGS